MESRPDRRLWVRVKWRVQGSWDTDIIRLILRIFTETTFILKSLPWSWIVCPGRYKGKTGCQTVSPSSHSFLLARKATVASALRHAVCKQAYILRPLASWTPLKYGQISTTMNDFVSVMSRADALKMQLPRACLAGLTFVFHSLAGSHFPQTNERKASSFGCGSWTHTGAVPNRANREDQIHSCLLFLPLI